MRVETSHRFTGRRWCRIIPAGGLLALSAVFFGAPDRGMPDAAAAPLPGVKAKDTPPAAPQPKSDYGRRVVGYINGNTPITREDLGEYLIAREGADKLELLVNKRIIELACKEKGIDVTAAEVDQELANDVKSIGINTREFVDKVLRHYNKTLYEWKEDVIRPKLMMTKLCRDRVHVTDEDLQMAFDAYYGEKVECRIILFPKGSEKLALEIHAKVRNDEQAFDREARHQASPTLAAAGGQIRPMGHHTTGNEDLEKEAFSLQPGEVSAVKGTPEGPVILKCVRHIEADKTKKLETERAFLEKEVLDKKIQAEIPVAFKELRDRARPVLFLKNYDREEDVLRDAAEEVLTPDTESPHGPTRMPHGN